MPDDFTLTMTDAGMALGVPFHRVRDLAMRGVLRARRGDDGRWRISEASVDDYKRATAATRTPHAA